MLTLLTNGHALGPFSIIKLSQGVQSFSPKLIAGYSAESVLAVSKYVSYEPLFGFNDPTLIMIFF